MRQPTDLLPRAYATLGLRPGCSRREAARQYKRLVRRWHPDQYGSDSQGQAEAALRMREINRAFALLNGAATTDVVHDDSEPPTTNDAAAEPRSRFFGQRLSETDLREIADSIGGPDVVGTLGRYLFWGGSLACGGILILQPGRPRGTMNSLAGALLLSAAATHWIYRMWSRTR